MKNKIKTVKILDLVKELKLGKNVKKKDLELVIKAFPKTIKRILLEKTELYLTGFIKIGFRVKQDQITTSRYTGERLNMPSHKRVKIDFYPEAKKYLNS